jgi:two-component system, OmpR family, manganese sensing sensor histidine kinase
MNNLFQTTRLRLALWYTAVTAVLLLLFATGVYLYVRTTLIDRIDDTLKHVVEVLDRSLVIQPVGTMGKYRVNIEASFGNKGVAVEDDRIDLEWFTPTGELVWSTFAEPLNLPIHPNRKGETVSVGGDRNACLSRLVGDTECNRSIRQVTERIEIDRQILGYLRVSHPWFEVTKPIRQLLRDLIIGIVMMVTSTATLGWFLSGIAMKPVNDSYQSLKQFTADASHELRNPIATIQTNVQMALAYPDAEPQAQQRQLRVIERLTQRLGRLVNDLLFLARSDSGIVETKRQVVPLDALLIEAIEEQRIAAENKGMFLSLHIVEPKLPDYEIDPETREDIFSVKGDWDQLARLFTNLISNALEYTPIAAVVSETNSSIDRENQREAAVEVELELVKRSFKNNTRRDRYPYLQVKVKDNGGGISETDLAHIFDRFYRVDPARSHQQTNSISSGAGLGLAIVRAIVENHQGYITVESVVDRGTTFTVMLPSAAWQK